MDFLGRGVYPMRHAARLAEADPAAVRRWMLGYSRRGQRYAPLWLPDAAANDASDESLSFRDLLELRLVAAFARHGVSTHIIRATIDAAREHFGVSYPLSTKRFRTDGRRIFLEAVDAAGEPELVDVLRKQYVFSAIVEPSLFAGVDYEGEVPRRWYPPDGRRRAVVLDPAVQFGTPIVVGAGVPTDTIAAAFQAEGQDRHAVARIFGVTPQQVDAAVRFEQRLAA